MTHVDASSASMDCPCLSRLSRRGPVKVRGAVQEMRRARRTTASSPAPGPLAASSGPLQIVNSR